MNKNVLIFIPNTLEKFKAGYLTGCYKEFEDCEAYYITSDSVSNNVMQCIGYVGRNLKNIQSKLDKSLFMNIIDHKILVNNCKCDSQPTVEIVYDYKGFKNSDVVYKETQSYGKHFELLTDELRKKHTLTENGRKEFLKIFILFIISVIDLILKICSALKLLLFCSATFIHFKESTVNFRWFLRTFLDEKRITPKIGNAMLAKAIDLLIGMVLLNWFLSHENYMLNIIQTSIENIITNLKDLLLYLMGSPIGLKLNYSFNKALAQFFFYHISLWRAFLLGMQPLLRAYYKFLVFPGALGFSFQIAMFSDIISFGTFHVYCIYVYAARMFALQVRGLVSLWRLFIGRKFNPLRDRVDSCQYSPNQLFIGTLGFTILLFLLPTTAMYYTVFTTFRFVILLVDGVLTAVRYILNALPLYVVALWIFNSSRVAGTVYMNWKCNEHKVTIEAKLNTLSLGGSVKKFIPDTIELIKYNSISYIFHCMVTGVLI